MEDSSRTKPTSKDNGNPKANSRLIIARDAILNGHCKQQAAVTRQKPKQVKTEPRASYPQFKRRKAAQTQMGAAEATNRPIGKQKRIDENLSEKETSVGSGNAASAREV